MKTQLKEDLIDYIRDKHFDGIDYGTHNTYKKNNSILNDYLKVCNKLNILDKIPDMIRKEETPLKIIYDELVQMYTDEPLPEMIDDTFHVSKQARCLAMNTLNGYTQIDTSDENKFFKEFSNTTPLKNTLLGEQIHNHIKKCGEYGNNEDEIERVITALKTNIYLLKRNHSKNSIIFGWMFESMMYHIICDFIHKVDNEEYPNECEYNISNVMSTIDDHIKKIPNAVDNLDTIDEYKQELHKIVDRMVGNREPCEKYVQIGLHDVINEQINMTKDDLINTYLFFQDLTTNIDDQILPADMCYLDVMIDYVEYILIPQIDHLLNTYIKTIYGGDVVDIIKKPCYSYGNFHGTGDYIIAVNSRGQNVYILADSKCYTNPEKEELLTFLYQLIGYRQLHRHKSLIPSYRQANDYNLDAFMIINPLNNIHRTMCFNNVKLFEYQREVEEFENAYEEFIAKTIQ